MRVAIATLIVLPSVDPTDEVVDLFGLKDTPLPYLGKRPCTNDPDFMRQEVGITEEEQFELMWLLSIQQEAS